MKTNQNMLFSEMQDCAKEVLRDVKNYCDNNNLKYYLAYGTLLGAVRHNDIIPWDYDIDIYMPRPDLDRMLQMAAKEPINDHIRVFSWEDTRGYYLSFVKVCDTRTRLVITRSKSDIPFGVWIDIFPLDGIPEDADECNKLIVDYRKGAKDAWIPVTLLTGIKSKVKNYLPIKKVLKIGQTTILSDIEKLALKTDYYQSATVGCIAGFDDVSKDFFPKEMFGDGVMLKFGDTEYRCPKNYDYILSKQYGDYMTPTPENERPDASTINAYFVSD